MSLPEPRPGIRAGVAPPFIVPLEDLRPGELEPLLAHEHVCWSQRLGWDYRATEATLLRSAANGTITGYAQRAAGAVIAYAYFVAKPERSHLGGAHALPAHATSAPPRPLLLVERGIDHLKQRMCTARIESQFFYFAEEPLDPLLEEHGFRPFPRRFLSVPSKSLLARVGGGDATDAIRAWRRSDRRHAARVVHAGFVDSVDAAMSACYATLEGCLLFCDGVTERHGCGVFDAEASAVALHEGEVVGVILASQISTGIGHIVQLSVTPAAQHRGLGRRLLRTAIRSFAARGFSSVTLAVSSENRRAHDWYLDLGFTPVHDFKAWAWGS